MCMYVEHFCIRASAFAKVPRSFAHLNIHIYARTHTLTREQHTRVHTSNKTAENNVHKHKKKVLGFEAEVGRRSGVVKMCYGSSGWPLVIRWCVCMYVLL